MIEGDGRLGSPAAPGRPVRPGSSVSLPPGASCSLAAAGPEPLRLDSMLLPASAPGAEADGTGPTGADGRRGPDGTAGALADLAAPQAEITSDPRVRVLFAPGRAAPPRPISSVRSPPGRAPLHSHT